MFNLKFKTPTIKDYLYIKEIWEDEKTMNDVGGIVPIRDSSKLNVTKECKKRGVISDYKLLYLR